MSSSWRSLLLGIVVLSVSSSVRAEDYQDKSRHYSLTLPEGWGVIPANEIAEANKIAAQRMPDQKISYQTGFRLKEGSAQGYPYILVQWAPQPPPGSYDDIERSLKKQQVNRGSKIKKVQGAFADELKGLSLGDTALDRQRNRLMTRADLDVAGVGIVQAISVGFLGKDGILYLHCYEREPAVRDTLPTFEKILDSFHYEPGYAFQPRSGWGSAALLGAAAGGIVGVIVAGPIVFWRWWQKKAVKVDAP